MKLKHKIHRLLKAIIFIAPLLMLIISCGDDECNDDIIAEYIARTDNIYNGNDSLQATFFNNRIIWRCHDFDHYQMTIQTNTQVCWGIPFLVEVKNEAIVEVVAQSEDGEKWIPHCATQTVEDLFYRIEDAIDPSIPLTGLKDPRPGDFNPNVADRVRINYHPTYGFPDEAYIDYDFGTADEEFGWQILDFQMLE